MSKHAERRITREYRRLARAATHAMYRAKGRDKSPTHDERNERRHARAMKHAIHA